jgi:hypothetical protein
MCRFFFVGFVGSQRVKKRKLFNFTRTTRDKREDVSALLSLVRTHHSALIYRRDDSTISSNLSTQAAYCSSVGSGHPFSRK